LRISFVMVGGIADNEIIPHPEIGSRQHAHALRSAPVRLRGIARWLR